MTTAELTKRADEMLAEEYGADDPGLYWLSFVQEGRGFVGAAVVHAYGICDAVKQTHALGINPGGEVATIRLPDDAPVTDEMKNKLLSMDDIRRFELGPCDLEGNPK